ncbi:MAG: dihydrofolate reductase family protein [Caryophanon sp.]|nr:dihydrofolate reductase family protein [Caryophanon sp.]
MRRVKVFLPMTLDHYVATEQGNLNWLNNIEGFHEEGFGKMYDSIDTLVVSRPMLEWLDALPNMTFPYKTKTCYVFSRSDQATHDGITWVNEDVTTFLQTLKQQDGGDIWLLGGGQFLRTVLDARLVDEVIVTIAPIILGSGIPFFSGVLNTQHLSLQHVETFGQFVEIRYAVVPT